MNILITGIHGFVGSNLVLSLKERHILYGLDIVAPKKEGVIKTYSWDELEGVEGIDVIVLGEKVRKKQVKGCPETYDTEKLRQKLEKIKIEDILWPIYDRNLHDVVEDQIKVTKDIILIEGNWLLLKQEPWKSMQQYADYKILILAEEEMLKERLISRKEKGGLTREEAVEWYQNSDSKNVKRVLKNSCRKHLNLLLQVEQDNDYLQVK